MANKSLITLNNNVKNEAIKFEKNRDKLQLVDDLHSSLFDRLFKITKDVILVQKFIFETNIK
ncbi:MAG: hypothetical protein NWQ07_00505 [Flaviramulus sp.]|nr:hypothetical protein [Flaviramulus sp.]